MNPVFGRVATCENPERTFFCWPRSITLHDGIFERFVKPPATPSGRNSSKFQFLHFGRKNDTDLIDQTNASSSTRKETKTDMLPERKQARDTFPIRTRHDVITSIHFMKIGFPKPMRESDRRNGSYPSSEQQ